jgi:hypothetical protein
MRPDQQEVFVRNLQGESLVPIHASQRYMADV